MPKKGNAAVRSRHLSTRRKRAGKAPPRDWIQYAPMTAQLASSIAARMEAIRH